MQSNVYSNNGKLWIVQCLHVAKIRFIWNKLIWPYESQVTSLTVHLMPWTYGWVDALAILCSPLASKISIPPIPSRNLSCNCAWSWTKISCSSSRNSMCSAVLIGRFMASTQDKNPFKYGKLMGRGVPLLARGPHEQLQYHPPGFFSQVSEEACSATASISLGAVKSLGVVGTETEMHLKL